MTEADYIQRILDDYIRSCKTIKEANASGACSKSIRRYNFPEFISETLIKLVIQKHCLDIKNCESSKTGDLICKAGKIECKCFTSLGPTSFGHTEKWKYLFVLDGIDIINKRQLKVYRINLDNNKFSKIVMVNKRETMKKQCNGNKRPRIAWKSLYPQIKNNTVKVYDGSIEDIFKSE